tara:strand:+ start:357 stop:833 length:477 start_codon:yes stop_codon:yes gene_type:complete
MSLAETELNIGGTSFKGVYIAILLSLATTLGGGVWTASSLYSRLTAVEAVEIPNIKPLEETIGLMQQQLESNDVSTLAAKLATLGTNIEVVVEQQDTMLEIQKQVYNLEKEVETMRTTVKTAELMTKDLEGLDTKLKTIDREIEDLWNGMDYLSNPLK